MPKKTILDHLNDVVDGYNFDKILQDFKTTPKKHQENYKEVTKKIPSIIDTNGTQKRILDVITKTFDTETLRNLDKTRNSDVIQNSETISAADVHGDLVSLLKNLYSSGIIDKEGNWSGGNKTLVQLGDVIHRKDYGYEASMFLRGLQNQAKESNGKVVLLIGNHEIESLTGTAKIYGGIYESSAYDQIYKHSFKQDIANGTMVAAYADPNRNLIFSHAGIEKGVLIEVIKEMESGKYKDAFEKLISDKKDEGPSALSKSGKLKSEDIYNFMKGNNITNEDVVSYLNEETKHRTKVETLTLEDPETKKQFQVNKVNPPAKYKLDQANFSNGPIYWVETDNRGNMMSGGIFHTRKKEFDTHYVESLNPKPYKATQVIGHTTKPKTSSKGKTVMTDISGANGDNMGAVMAFSKDKVYEVIAGQEPTLILESISQNKKHFPERFSDFFKPIEEHAKNGQLKELRQDLHSLKQSLLSFASENPDNLANFKSFLPEIVKTIASHVKTVLPEVNFTRSENRNLTKIIGLLENKEIEQKNLNSPMNKTNGKSNLDKPIER